MKRELANNYDVMRADIGDLQPDRIRRVKVEGVVDSGAAHLVIPESAMKALGLEEVWQAKVRYAAGHAAERPVVKMCGFACAIGILSFLPSFEPGRDTALIGAIVLEELDLLVDCITQTLHPRDPNIIITEIE